MAQPLNQAQGQPERIPPKTVATAKEVKLAVVRYTDDSGYEFTSLALVGEGITHMIDSRPFGLSRVPTPQGRAASWLHDQIRERLEAHFNRPAIGDPAPTGGK